MAGSRACLPRPPPPTPRGSSTPDKRRRPGHISGSPIDRRGYEWGGLPNLTRSLLLGQLRRLLVAAAGPGNGWTANVQAVGRKPRRPTVMEDWWLGDMWNRERVPNWSAVGVSVAGAGTSR